MSPGNVLICPELAKGDIGYTPKGVYTPPCPPLRICSEGHCLMPHVPLAGHLSLVPTSHRMAASEPPKPCDVPCLRYVFRPAYQQSAETPSFWPLQMLRPSHRRKNARATTAREWMACWAVSRRSQSSPLRRAR